MKGFQNELTFLNLVNLKKGTYIVSGVAPVRVFLMECFRNFLGTNPHSFTKETKFMQSFMELNMKKASIFANKASFKLEF